MFECAPDAWSVEPVVGQPDRSHTPLADDRRPSQEHRALSEPGDRPTSEGFSRETLPYREPLFRYAWKITGQRADAEDLLQDTMLKAYVSYGNLRQGSNVRAWLYQIMANTWIDRHRSSQRRPVEDLNADVTDLHLRNPDSAAQARSQSPESLVLGALPGEAQLALESLPEGLRAALYLADIEGYRNTEIAQLLEIPAGTVASRLHRGRQILRQRLALS